MSRITPYLLRPTAGNTLDPFYLKLFSMQPKFSHPTGPGPIRILPSHQSKPQPGKGFSD